MYRYPQISTGPTEFWKARIQVGREFSLSLTRATGQWGLGTVVELKYRYRTIFGWIAAGTNFEGAPRCRARQVASFPGFGLGRPLLSATGRRAQSLVHCRFDRVGCQDAPSFDRCGRLK